MSILVTTQSYKKDVPTEFGLLLEMDENSGEILAQKKIITKVKFTTNGQRVKPGLRGISIYKNKIYTCSWNTIYVLNNSSFEIEGEISHPWMSDLHGIHVDQQGIWATSSLPDALLLFDFDGSVKGQFWVSESKVYPEKTIVEKDLDWRLIGKDFRGFKNFHANNVSLKQNEVFLTGRGIGTANNKGRVLRFGVEEFLSGPQLEDSKINYFATGLYGPHDGIWNGDLFWVTETTSSTIAAIDNSGKVLHRKKITGSEKEQIKYDSVKDFLKTHVFRLLFNHGGKRITHWTRGLCVNENFIYVGQSTYAGIEQSKARIVKIDKSTLEIIDCFYLDIPHYPETRIFQIIEKNSLHHTN